MIMARSVRKCEKRHPSSKLARRWIKCIKCIKCINMYQSASTCIKCIKCIKCINMYQSVSKCIALRGGDAVYCLTASAAAHAHPGHKTDKHETDKL
jgi:hypothetical protein